MKLGPGVDSNIDEFVDFAGIDNTHDDQDDWTSEDYMVFSVENEPVLDVLGQYEIG